MKTIQTLLLITAAVLMPLAVADDVAALPAQEGAVRLYEIRQGGTDIEVEDEHSLIYIYKEQDGILTEITEVFAPGMRRWELRYRYDRHGNCLGAHHYYSHRVDADAPWLHEERELGAEDELELSYSPEKAELVHERGATP